ncbi:hypothetical protein KC353_g41 [Hortaea werneckii]|nr:hypothetical protein KC353_g41 [Hortaea werneckii]
MIKKKKVTTIVQQQVTAIVEKQLSSIQPSSTQASRPNPSYADLARTPPGSHPSNLRTLSNQTTPSTLTDTLYCTVDVSNVEEEKRRRGTGRMRAQSDRRDPRNSGRIRITCRDEEELAGVKSVDNACRTAVLDENGELRPKGLTKGLRVYGRVRDEARRRSEAPGRPVFQRGRRIGIHPGVRVQTRTDAVLQMSGAWPQGAFVHQTAGVQQVRSTRPPSQRMPGGQAKVCGVRRTTRIV